MSFLENGDSEVSLFTFASLIASEFHTQYKATERRERELLLVSSSTCFKEVWSACVLGLLGLLSTYRHLCGAVHKSCPSKHM